MLSICRVLITPLLRDTFPQSPCLILRSSDSKSTALAQCTTAAVNDSCRHQYGDNGRDRQLNVSKYPRADLLGRDTRTGNASVTLPESQVSMSYDDHLYSDYGFSRIDAHRPHHNAGWHTRRVTGSRGRRAALRSRWATGDDL
ncbi:hypothetical protein EVAR_39928_1 [Eumeta japonica]|uniref:Uncharacterized protein n=1 Tax=Eumeta variegata TaxID=151549 RepID=A0A4C1WM33_EUMVA|nr:hypothetical protein EVAR_39928_1 [Eumeta japonica]